MIVSATNLSAKLEKRTSAPLFVTSKIVSNTLKYHRLTENITGLAPSLIFDLIKSETMCKFKRSQGKKVIE